VVGGSSGATGYAHVLNLLGTVSGADAAAQIPARRARGEVALCVRSELRLPEAAGLLERDVAAEVEVDVAKF
jgi:hypothetical protein